MLGKNKMRYWIIFVLIFSGVFAKEPLSVEQLFNIKTTTVRKVDNSLNKEFYGYTKVNEANVKEITLRYDAFITELYTNQSFLNIKEGEVLAKVYSPEVYTAQQELLNALRIKNAGIIHSLTEKLMLLGVRQKTIDTVIQTKKAYENIFVNANISGTVTQKYIKEGSFVKKGSKLFEVTDFSSLWLIVSVYEKDMPFIRRANDVVVSFDFTDERYHGKVDYIYPRIDPKSKTVDVRIVMENKAGAVYENAFAKVHFSQEKREYLMLPSSSIITKGKKHIVFVKGEYEGEYIPKEIDAKRLGDGTFEILSGVKEGDIVVNNALFMLDSDAQINGLYQ